MLDHFEQQWSFSFKWFHLRSQRYFEFNYLFRFQISDFFDRTEELFREMQWQKKLRGNKCFRCFQS